MRSTAILLISATLFALTNAAPVAGDAFVARTPTWIPEKRDALRERDAEWRREAGGRDWRRDAEAGGRDWRRDAEAGGRDWRRDGGRDWRRDAEAGGRDWRRDAEAGGRDWKRDAEAGGSN